MHAHDRYTDIIVWIPVIIVRDAKPPHRIFVSNADDDYNDDTSQTEGDGGENVEYIILSSLVISVVMGFECFLHFLLLT